MDCLCLWCPSLRSVLGASLKALTYIGRNWLKEYDFTMNVNLRELPVEDRIRLVEDLWDNIAKDQQALPLTPEQAAELDRRLESLEVDGDLGRPASDVILDIRKRR
jgi:putative addiction module component (TIGR02574 family)